MSLEGVRRASGFATHGVVKRAGVVDLQDSGDLEYYMNVTLGGRSYRVLVDSGSADFWVAGDVPKSSTKSSTVVVQYQDGVISGTLNTATLQVGEVTITNQTYIAQAVDASHPDGQGLLGIGPSRLSLALASLSAPAGNPVMDNLIALQGSGSSYVTTFITRPDNSSEVVPAQLTVGEVVADHADVQTAVQLPVSKNGWDAHWMVSLDDGGIIGSDKKKIAASEGKQLKVVFHSGYTMSQVSDTVAEAIYSRVPGAKLSTIDASPLPVWTLPCNFELNVTFNFGGVSYPVHPLDTVMNDIAGPSDGDGSPSCVGAFQPTNASNPYDILLGMTFLRNAYILMNLSDQPYVQLLSLTDPAQAHQEFVQQRLGGVDTTGSQQLLPDSAGLSDNSKTKTAVEKNKVFIIAGIIIGTFILLSILGIIVVWYRKRRYHRLHAPAPEGALLQLTPQTSPAWKEFKDPEPKTHLKAFALPLSARSRSTSPARAPQPAATSYEEYKDALARKKGAGDLMPNRKSSVLAAARRKSSLGVVPGQSGGEGSSLLDKAGAPAVASPPPSTPSQSSLYSQENDPILVIEETSLPALHDSEEEHDRESEKGKERPPADNETEVDLPLMTPADSRRLTNPYGVTEPQTPRPPARADTPDPYDLPPLPPPPVTATEPLRTKRANALRPLPNPPSMPMNAPEERVAEASAGAFESLPRVVVSGPSKKTTVLPALDISSATLGKGKPSKPSKPSRPDRTQPRS